MLLVKTQQNLETAANLLASSSQKRVSEKQNSLFPLGQVIKCLLKSVLGNDWVLKSITTFRYVNGRH